MRIAGLVLLALAVSLPVVAGDTSPHRSAFVEANGVKLHYLEWNGGGKQGVLLMLAGLGNDAHIFDGFAGRFTDRYRVLALTRRGWGESGKPRTGYDVKTRVEDLRRFLDALGLAKVTLVGHSIAGDELTAFASQYPARVDKVVYLDAAYDRSKTEDLLSDDPALTFLPNRGLSAGNDAIRAQLMKGSSAFHPDYRAIRAPALAFYAVPRLHPAFRKAPTADDLKRMNAWWTAKGVPHIRANIEQFRRQARHGQAVEMPYADHFLFLGSTQDEVVQRMREFLSRRAGLR
jgi:pimeloyl-ACP methyl ester carboxylesterase